MCTRWWPVKKERNVESLRLKPTGLKTGKTLISCSLDHNAIFNPRFPSNTMTELSRVPICQESAGWNIQFPFFVVDIYIGFVIDQIFSLIYWNFLLYKFSLIYWGKKIFWNIYFGIYIGISLIYWNFLLYILFLLSVNFFSHNR